MLIFLNVGVGFFSLLIPLSILAFVLFVWALVKCISNKSLSSTDQILWLLVIFLAPFLGAIAYFIVNGNDNKKQTESA